MWQFSIGPNVPDLSEISNGTVGVEITMHYLTIRHYFPSDVGFTTLSHTVGGQSGMKT